ncbi:hypothetical protein PRUPE_3G222900 [Prunus persica]|uniref:Uncharacterized protein n=1 Tax=Prunus persica TaxID=3760 RepID=A0A251Q429_PRUPE|nr:hypothetical protein PRUPE_3G222900 [Prunus persica]
MWDARGVVVFFGQMDVELAGMFLLLDLPIRFGGPRIKHRNIYCIHLWSPLTCTYKSTFICFSGEL